MFMKYREFIIEYLSLADEPRYRPTPGVEMTKFPYVAFGQVQKNLLVQLLFHLSPVK